MNRIPRGIIRNYILQTNFQNNSKKDCNIENQNLTKYNNTKFYISRNFGKEISNITKNNDKNGNNFKKIDNKMYIKNISSNNNNTNLNYKESNYTNYTNKLGGFISRNNCNNNIIRSYYSKGSKIIKKEEKKIQLNNSISYGNSNINRPYSNNSRNTNNNMISVRVSNNNKSKRKINDNQTNIYNRTYIRNTITNEESMLNYYNKNSKNYQMQQQVKSINNKEKKVNSMNNKISIRRTVNKENISLNINETEHKIIITQYNNRESSSINRINRDISLGKEIKKEKIKYFDESKIKNVQIPKDYINTIYYNLLKEEDSSVILSLKENKNFMLEQKEINPKMRSILIDWLIDVHFKFGFTDETLFLTVSIIDRYLSVSQISRPKFQLLGITALLISCKHEEIDFPKINDFIYITDNAYVKNDVLKMEYDILNKLDFSFLYPSPIKFFEYLSIHFNFDKKMYMMGKYLMESFLLDSNNFKYKPSIISCACIYIVMKFFKFKNYFEAYDKKFFNINIEDGKYTEGNIKDCAKEICLFVDNINKTNYQACVKKYSKIEQEKVAILIMNN